MSKPVISIENVVKSFGTAVVLDDVTLAVEKGKICGIIGRNGSGKTVLFKCICGLLNIDSGKIQADRTQLGVIIEEPGFLRQYSGKRNLQLLAGLSDKPHMDITEVMTLVGLKDAMSKKVGKYSMGMRQRLGIAIAILNTPELLILDEPINGLDPAGIVEIRELLKKLNQTYGMTILVSSHILSELYRTASQFILIDKGKILEQISEHELDERCKRHIAIQAKEPEKALLLLEEQLQTENLRLMPDGMIRLYDHLDDIELVAKLLTQAHLLVTGLHLAGDKLEDYFLGKVGGASHE